jgi:hypothetical protein
MVDAAVGLGFVQARGGLREVGVLGGVLVHEAGNRSPYWRGQASSPAHLTAPTARP